MQVIQEQGSRPIKIWTNKVEESALVQLKDLARLPFLASNGVAVMPDVHAGIGSTVGSVIATVKAVIPAAVGVDIGCGMVALRTSLTADDLPDNLLELRQNIEQYVPTGFTQHKDDTQVEKNWGTYGELYNKWLDLRQKYNFKVKEASVQEQLGSLGGGNHFIEICLDQQDGVWVMLHSGSRGVGNAIGREFIDIAKERCAQWHIDLPHQDLAYLPEGTKDFDDYVEMVGWAQEYAFTNRAVMLDLVCHSLAAVVKPFTILDEAINCHHNYIEKESHFGQNLWVTRKGAIRARNGDLGIIPGSMGQRSYIVRGKGNAESYCSCSHGAGRVMSRTAAKKAFSLTDLVKQTEGVECRKEEALIDEIPGAYKNIDEVMANQTELVEIVHTLKQVLCVKGT